MQYFYYLDLIYLLVYQLQRNSNSDFCINTFCLAQCVMTFNFIFGCPFWTKVNFIMQFFFPPPNWFIELSRSLEGGKTIFFIPAEIGYRFCTCPAPQYHYLPVGSLPAWKKMWSHPESQKTSCKQTIKAEEFLPIKGLFKSVCLVEKAILLFFKKKNPLIKV